MTAFVCFFLSGKFRPNFGLCLGGSMDETVLSSLSKPPATPPLKVQKQPTSSKPSALAFDSTPKLRQSGRNLLSFRTQTPTNVNPIVAFSNDPSIQLTSFRKVDQDSTPILPSAVTNSNENPPSPSSRFFPYQSDSDITHTSRLHKQPSRYSLPDVPFQRDNNAASTELPEFLSPTPEKTDEHEKVVAASTFGDSSMKSKVLQASFRGKAGTMDRRTASTTTTPFRHTPNLSTKRTIPTQPKYFTTSKTPENSSDGPVKCSLDSVLNLTLQLEQSATADYQRRHTISTNDIDPLLLNGLTDDENTLNLMEKTNGHEDNSDDNDRIQNSSSMNSQLIEYVVHKEKIKHSLPSKYSNLMFYSDFSSLVCPIPYFYQQTMSLDSNGVHLVICVHGLDGNSGDLRLVKTYLELCLPTSRLDFLMSSSNHSSTFDDIDIMVKQLIDEIETHTERYGLKPRRISFVGHSLGNLVVRATVAHPRFERYRTLLYTYLSLSGPHLGTLFNSSGLVNMGMWLMQKWKKSCSLSQMSFKDHVEPRQTYLYKLSKKPCKSRE